MKFLAICITQRHVHRYKQCIYIFMLTTRYGSMHVVAISIPVLLSTRCHPEYWMKNFLSYEWITARTCIRATDFDAIRIIAYWQLPIFWIILFLQVALNHSSPFHGFNTGTFQWPFHKRCLRDWEKQSVNKPEKLST